VDDLNEATPSTRRTHLAKSDAANGELSHRFGV
jgi:hypothetical protein